MSDDQAQTIEAPSSADDPRRGLANYLKFLKRAGFLYLLPGEEDEPMASKRERAEVLESLRVHASTCTKCPLAETRTHVVFGEGSPDADIMFVGEAPGADEDRLGRPFVGRAGKLLDQMIEKVGLQRSDVFICNTLKCRPPGNRDPKPEEKAACESYLLGQIDAIQPKVIITLGNHATHSLTGEKTGITRMRGRFYSYHDTKVMPTLHPAAVLRNMNQMEDVLADLRKAVAVVSDM